MIPYQYSSEERELLEQYAQALKQAERGFDGVPPAHLQALLAVRKSIAEETRTAVLAEVDAADIGALTQVANAASLLVAFADMAVSKNSTLREEAKSVIQRLHGLLDAAGYTERDTFIGYHQRPGFEFSARDYI